MSELKTYNSERIYWAVEQVERAAGDIEDLHLDDTSFYLKSEADKVIAGLKESRMAWIHRCGVAEENERHQKYKRCLDTANYWLAIGYHCIDDKHKQRAEQRHYKWLELAKKFREADK